MAYGYSFDEASPRFALTSLWFLVGVIVFGFAVLGMTAIVTSEPDRGYYLNVHEKRVEPAKPAVTRNNVPTTGTSSRYHQ